MAGAIGSMLQIGSGENLFVVLLMMLHPTQELEPPANPARFSLRIASSIRNAIRGSQHVAKILSFLDEIKPIFDKIGDLAKKLRQSIEEVGERVMDQLHRVVRSSRYWRKRLDDLARQGHGPQRHEGDVTPHSPSKSLISLS